MDKEIIDTLSEIIALLEDCGLPAWVEKFAKWKQEIAANVNNPKKLCLIYKELYVASGPRGFLGDFPLTLSKNRELTREFIEKRRRILVDKLITQLEAFGLGI